MDPLFQVLCVQKENECIPGCNDALWMVTIRRPPVIATSILVFAYIERTLACPPKNVSIRGKVVEIRGGIKSLDPPCQEESFSCGHHPYTCDNCHIQLHELKDIIWQRKSGSLPSKANRLGFSGFNKRYARRDEAVNALEDVNYLRQK